MYCTTGLHDTIVPYWKIMKLIVKIREHKTDSNTQIIRIETTQCILVVHLRYKSIKELAEKYSFVFTR